MYGGRSHDRQRGPAEQHHPDDHKNALCHGRGRVSAGGPNSQAPAIRNSMAGDHRFCSGVCAAFVEEFGAADLGLYLAALGNHGADRALRWEASAVEARAATFFCGARRTSGIGLRCRRSGSDGNRGPAGRRGRLVRHYWGVQRADDWAGGVLGRSGAVAKWAAAGQTAVIQLTQSKNLYQAPAKGRNQGLPEYRPNGASGNGMPTKGFSTWSPAIISAIFCPWYVAMARPCPAYPTA